VREGLHGVVVVAAVGDEDLAKLADRFIHRW
jgi:hypothetical protein